MTTGNNNEQLVFSDVVEPTILDIESEAACVRHLITTLRQVVTNDPTDHYLVLSSLPGSHHDLAYDLTEPHLPQSQTKSFSTEGITMSFEYQKREFKGVMVEFAKRQKIDEAGNPTLVAWGVRRPTGRTPFFHTGVMQLEQFPYLDSEPTDSQRKEIDDLERLANQFDSTKEKLTMAERQMGGLTIALSLQGEYAEVVYGPSEDCEAMELPSGKVTVWGEQGVDAFHHLFSVYAPSEHARIVSGRGSLWAEGTDDPMTGLKAA